MKIESDEKSRLAETLERAPEFAVAAATFLSDTLTNGTRVGDYVIKGILASGGFGMVYRAMHAESGNPAAVKVLHPELIAHDNDALRFQREIEVVRKLRHPNVVEIFDFGQLADGRPYFVMELLSGQTLEQFLVDRGRLSVDETIQILEPLADALDLAHAHAIVHRDLKPSNVFLCDSHESRRVVLLDFGVAKLLNPNGESLTASRQIIGTLACMSPEQLLGESIDSRTDVYAVGILAYVMITGQTPFDVGVSESDNPIAFLYTRYVRPIAPSQHVRIHAALDAPLLRPLAHERQERPATVGEFVHELKSAIRAVNGSHGQTHIGTERYGIAVHVEVHVDSTVLENPDELFLLDLESIFPLASSVLMEAGLVPVLESGNNMLAVTACPEDPSLWPSLRKRVVETILQARTRVAQRSGADSRIALTFVGTMGSLLINGDGALVGGALLDPATWLPAFQAEGVLLSKGLTEGIDVTGSVIPEAPDFILDQSA